MNTPNPLFDPIGIPDGTVPDVDVTEYYADRSYETSLHLGPVLSPRRLKTAIERMVGILKDYPLTFDTIAFCGSSGALVAPALAQVLDKELILVRKKEGRDGSEYPRRWAEGYRLCEKFLILDDTAVTHRTINNILRGTKQFVPRAICVGIYLYNEYTLLTQGSKGFEQALRSVEESGGQS